MGGAALEIDTRLRAILVRPLMTMFHRETQRFGWLIALPA